MSDLDKISGCYLLGACGDALGAPIEGLRKLEDIIATFGPEGLRDIVEFKNAYEKGLDYPAGRVTDDTTMAMTTAAALIKTLNATKLRSPAFTDRLRADLWQGYLNWAVHQDEAEVLQGRADETGWPPLARDFWFACGAGRGTIAALMQKAPGSVAQPLVYDETIRGRRVRGPNPGCGGMMRVAPLAFLPKSPEKVFEIACESAAVTHGDQAAYVATGAVALMIHFAAKGVALHDIHGKTMAVLEKYRAQPLYAAGVEACLNAMNMADAVAAMEAPSLKNIDRLPTMVGHSNPFLAVPVLAQVTYTLACADYMLNVQKGALPQPDEGWVKDVMALSANHSGDSDSVAAIVGNILGARYGQSIVPNDWSDILLQKKEILAMAAQTYAALGNAPRATLHILKKG